nr:hypothetical protein BSM_05360 [uncultured archaeon]CBH40074.1 hypothetical protein BSM_35530 [uncultured archaeon]
MEKIPGWIERLLLPKLNEITGEIKALEAKIEGVDNKVDVRIDAVEKEIASLRSETKTEIAGLRKEMLSKFESVDSRFDSFEAMVEFKALLNSIGS